MKTNEGRFFIAHGEVAFESPCNGNHILIRARSEKDAWNKLRQKFYAKHKTARWRIEWNMTEVEGVLT